MKNCSLSIIVVSVGRVSGGTRTYAIDVPAASEWFAAPTTHVECDSGSGEIDAGAHLLARRGDGLLSTHHRLAHAIWSPGFPRPRQQASGLLLNSANALTFAENHGFIEARDAKMPRPQESPSNRGLLGVNRSPQEKSKGRSMDKFTTLTGIAAPYPVVNIDTDMIIPKDYLKTIKRTGLGTGLFAEARYNEDGSENPDFVLNKPAYRHAQILVAGDNFGCGSSREHAPWALLDFGIRCVISTSFADIFYNNCFKNGILPIVVSPDELEKLLDDAGRGANATLTVDLETQEIKGPDGGTIKFDVDAFRKYCLLNGLDDIGLTLEKATAIDAFEKKAANSRPWA
jgi:3-isopropylmalate/(R)-2-methylmalate dehydratase small subunit